MASYQSRYQPRRHLVVMGKLLQPETYDRFYDLATDNLCAGRFPQTHLHAGQILIRAVEAGFSIDQARHVPLRSSMNSNNRFSAPRLNEHPGQGALYLDILGGTLREHSHYELIGRQPSGSMNQAGLPPLWVPGRGDRLRDHVGLARAGLLPPGRNRFHLFQTTQPLLFADLRLTALLTLWLGVLGFKETRQRCGIVDHASLDQLLSQASAAQDYSAARGLAYAVADALGRTGHVGVCAFSSRADTETGLVNERYGGPSGGLVFAIFGSDSLPVSTVVPAHAPAPAVKPRQITFDSLQDMLVAIT